MKLPNLLALSDADFAALFTACVQENARRETIRRAKEVTEEAAKKYAAAVAGQEAKDIKALDASAVVGPGEMVIVDGTTWENVSGAWLSPFAAGPVNYPLGWKRAGSSAVKPDDLPEWKVDTAYKTGDKASYGGKAYECVQGHKSQAGWEPPAVAALWKLA